MNAVSDQELDTIRHEAAHAARALCVRKHSRLTPAETPCQSCVDDATVVLVSRFVLVEKGQILSSAEAVKL